MKARVCATVFTVLIATGCAPETKQTSSTFCTMKAGDYWFEVVPGLQDVTEISSTRVSMDPGFGACTINRAPWPSQGLTPTGLIQSAQKTDNQILASFANLLSQDAEVRMNEVGDTVYGDPAYFYSATDRNLLLSVSVIPDPDQRFILAGNCALQKPFPDSALGLQLRFLASPHFAPNQQYPECGPGS